jgi:hypothetical protein
MVWRPTKAHDEQLFFCYLFFCDAFRRLYCCFGMCICAHVPVNVCRYRVHDIYMYVCMCVCMYVRIACMYGMYVYMYVCMYACVRVYLCIHACVYTSVCMYACMYGMYVCENAYVRTCGMVSYGMHVYMLVCMRTQYSTEADMHTRTHKLYKD